MDDGGEEEEIESQEDPFADPPQPVARRGRPSGRRGRPPGRAANHQVRPAKTSNTSVLFDGGKLILTWLSYANLNTSPWY